MFLDNFHDLGTKSKFQRLTESLKRDFGVDMAVYQRLTEKELNRFSLDLMLKKQKIVFESEFNSYYDDPEYVRTSLLIEAIRILKEIRPKRTKGRKVKETSNYKVHHATSVAVDHDLDEDKERPDLYWRKDQYKTEKDQENHPVTVMDAAPAGEAYSTSDSPATVEPYAQNVEPDPTRTKEDYHDAAVYVAIMDPNKFLGDKEPQIMSIAPTVQSENETSVLTRKVSPVMVDATENYNPEGGKEMRETKKNNGMVEGLGLLVEGELERAEIVLATKDLVARLQKMIEDLGNMGTDDIMPLVDGLRNNFNPQTAEQFSQKAEQHIQASADAIQGFKDTLDIESERLEGRISDEDSEKLVNDMSGDMSDMGGDMMDNSSVLDTSSEMSGEEALGDLLGGEEANASMEPLGRAKKEGRVLTISGKTVKLSEEQVNALHQTVLIKKKIAQLVEASKPKTAIITVEGRKIRLAESQIKALIFAKNFNKLVEAKRATNAKLTESQATMLWTAKQVSGKIRALIGTNSKNISLFDIVNPK